MKIVPFTPEHESEVVDLIVSIQREEFGIDIDAERQPDLRSIPSFYQTGAGSFWVATIRDRVVGTIALLDIGERQGALRKMVVRPDARGRETGTAHRLLEALLEHARSRDVCRIYLGTTAFFEAAHRFYEKNGFSEISKSGLPPSFPVMDVDTRFYELDVPARNPA